MARNKQEDATGMPNELDFGARMKTMRQERAWTLEQLAEKSGLSISTLSKIENGQVSASFDTIVKIAHAYDLTFGELFTEQAPANSPSTLPVAPISGRRTFTRAGKGLTFNTPNYKYNVHSSELTHKGMIPLIMQISARQVPPRNEWSSHEGEEFIYVTHGVTVLYTAWYAPLTLETGDSAYIDSTMPHAFISASDEEATILSICLTQRLHFKEGMVGVPAD
ncbi:helix-turn-helix domain-containing protein [Sodalis sp. RH16]|uniref:helix-turn-helix domain-containing protein n=1 Tax=unclassified Sodalis (in: enterobacteria) TaxID=2636512 RepID=UPI0039B42A1C